MKTNTSQRKFYELFFLISLGVLTTLWFICFIIDSKSPIVMSTFFMEMNDFLADLTSAVGYSAKLDPYNNTVYMSFADKAYPPLAYTILFPLSLLFDVDKYYKIGDFLLVYKEPAFMIVVSILLCAFFAIAFILIRRTKVGDSLLRTCTACVLLVSFPVLYTVERGNLILLAALLSYFFVGYYDSDNKVLKELSLISLAFAAGLKLSPALFGVILLINKKWKDSIRTVCYGLIAFFLPFFVFSGTFFSNIACFLRNIRLLTEKYANELENSCALRGMLNNISLSLGGNEFPSVSTTILKIVFLVLLVACVLLSKRKWEQIWALSLILITIPVYSGLYSLLYLLPAVVLFLNEEKHGRTDLILLVSLLFAFNPFRFGILSMFYQIGLLIMLLWFGARGIRLIVSTISSAPKTVSVAK